DDQHVPLPDELIGIDLLGFLQGAAEQAREHLAATVLGCGARAGDATGRLAGLWSGVDGELEAHARRVPIVGVGRGRLGAGELASVIADGNATTGDGENSHCSIPQNEGTNRESWRSPGRRDSQVLPSAPVASWRGRRRRSSPFSIHSKSQVP